MFMHELDHDAERLLMDTVDWIVSVFFAQSSFAGDEFMDQKYTVSFYQARKQQVSEVAPRSSIDCVVAMTLCWFGTVVGRKR